MPRYNVRLRDGSLRVFSTVVDDWITPPMSESAWRAWWINEARDQRARDCETFLATGSGLNRMSVEDAMERIRMREEADDALHSQSD